MIFNNDLSIEELAVFIEETGDQVRLLDDLINDLKNNNDHNKDILLQIFRIVHNIKGSSSIVGHSPMIDTVHSMEDIIENLRNSNISINLAIINNLLQFLDVLKKCINQLRLTTSNETKTDTNAFVKSSACGNVKLTRASAYNVTDQLSKFVGNLSRNEHKNISFRVIESTVDLNQIIVKQLKDALIHLLRNSVTHGIESPPERKEKGKLENAFIKLSGYQEAGHIIIKLEDDGRGIDCAKVLGSAVNNNLISNHHAKYIANEKIIDFIFSAGLSTTEKVTEMSGRGMGLDIVRQKISSLHGSVTVDTQSGKGTTFTIKIPLNSCISSQN